MKSLLQESSSIAQAITKAWSEAGQPSEFSIKILDAGEKNFLGMTKRPAVVSILFDAQKQTIHEVKPQTPTKQQPRQNYDQQRQSQQQRPTQQHPRQQAQSQQKPQFSRSQQETRPAQSQQQVQPQAKEQPADYWTPEMIEDVCGWTKELMALLQITVQFTTNPQQKLLNITFNDSIFPESEAERLLFSGLSYTLMQFLKKKYKKKFQSYRIMLFSKNQKRV